MAIVIAILTVLIGAVSRWSGCRSRSSRRSCRRRSSLTTTYTGADALTIEQSVATPIEQQMNGVDKMLYIQSTNANDGTMTQIVTFDVGTNIDIDNVLVQNRFAQAQTCLPQDVKNYGVTIKKSLAFPLIVFSLYSPDGRYDPNFLSNYALINVNDALLRVKGVGDIRNFGASRLRDAHLAQARRAGAAGTHRGRRAGAIRSPERGEPRRPDRRRARAARPAAHATPCAPRAAWSTPEEFGDDHRARRTPTARMVRLRRRGAGGARRAQLPASTAAFNGKPAAVIAAFQIARLQRARGRATASSATHGRARRALPAGHRLHGLARHHRCR